MKRVAVLPFENQGAAEDGYFAEGMTDEVRSKLTRLHGLAVIASASASQYRATTKPPEQIAKELGVGYLLVAKVRRQASGQASRIRVTPELVEVGSGGAPTARWQEAFDADLSDVFRVQGEIATKVAESLAVVLTGKERSLLEARPTSNLAAYDAYLKGQESIRAGYGFRAAVTLDEKAVALDPSFALAWASLSLCHSWIFATTEPSPHEAEEARVAAERAVELAPRANCVLCFVSRDSTRSLSGTASGAMGCPGVRGASVKLPPQSASDVCAERKRIAETLVSERQDGPQFPLQSYTALHFS